MDSLLTAVILLSLLFSGFTFAVEVGDDGGAFELMSTVAEQRELDYFIFALQWPQTFCATHSKTCCKQNACCRGASSLPGFTISGLWPEYDDGSWPSCCPGPAYNETQISSLLDALDTYWPTLNCKMVSSCNSIKRPFWAHQWEKFGTCSTSITGDEYGYFKKALDLYMQYDVTKILFTAGHVPSNSDKYASSGIVSAIQKAFNTTPQLSCKDDALNEVRLCFTKDFKLRECLGSGNCPEKVSLPVFVPRGVVDDTKTEGRWISGAQSS